MNGRIPVGLDSSGTPEAPGSKPAVLTRVVARQRASRFGTHHLGLVRKPDAELFLYPGPNLLRQRKQIGARAAAIHQRQRVTGRNPRPSPTSVSLGKPCVLDEPRGRDLHASVRRKRGDLLPALREVGEGGGRQHRVGEERAGRARVRVRWIEHHGLAAPQRKHGLTYQADRLARSNGVEPAELRHGALQLRIADAGPLIANQPQRDLKHDIPPSVRALGPAVPIPEGTLPRGEGLAPERGAVAAFDAHQPLRELLPVGAHVLYRRAAPPARDAPPAPDPRPPAPDHPLPR